MTRASRTAYATCRASMPTSAGWPCDWAMTPSTLERTPLSILNNSKIMVDREMLPGAARIKLRKWYDSQRKRWNTQVDRLTKAYSRAKDILIEGGMAEYGLNPKLPGDCRPAGQGAPGVRPLRLGEIDHARGMETLPDETLPCPV